MEGVLAASRWVGGAGGSSGLCVPGSLGLPGFVS